MSKNLFFFYISLSLAYSIVYKSCIESAMRFKSYAIENVSIWFSPNRGLENYKPVFHLAIKRGLIDALFICKNLIYRC